jgi:hydrogenase 3 maturation protease
MIREFLKKNIRPGSKYAVMGIGSVLCSDDAAGMYFIELFDGLVKRSDILSISGSTAPENFTGVIKDFAPEKLFMIDAAYMEMLPGEVRIIPAADIGGVSFSTHMLPLPLMLEYLKTETGCDVIFIGIQPQFTGHGSGMCRKVKNGTKRLAQDFYEAFK